MKTKYKLRLQEDKHRISRQIGILPSEEPRLVLDRKEMRSLLQSRNQYSKRIAAWGECVIAIRTIFVDAGLRVHHPCRQYKGFRNPKRELVKHKSKYIDFQNTLMHELVHYRWPYLQHGKMFEQRTQEIRRGLTFEPKHIHLFANHSKKRRDGIDADPDITKGGDKEMPPLPQLILTSVPTLQAKKKKGYDGTLDYFLVYSQ